MARKYENVVRFVQETPWAVKPEMLFTIRGIVAAKLAGVELEPVAAKQKPKQTVSGGGNAVAVLPLWGVMVPHADMMSNMSGGVGLDNWINDFRALVNDPSISTIILDVDSPGGAIAMVPETAAEIRAATGKKKIIAVANTEIASAAYWLASQADEIVAPASGQVGSVGVIAEHTDYTAADEMEGITKTYITAGEYKAEQLGPLTEEAKAAIQAKIDVAYAMFVGDIAKGRGVGRSAVIENYGKGRMLSANDALSVGMIDTIGTLDGVIARETGGKQRPAGLRAADEDVVVSANDSNDAVEASDTTPDMSGEEVTTTLYIDNRTMTIPSQIAATSSTAGLNLVPTTVVASGTASLHENHGSSASRGAIEKPQGGTMDNERPLSLEELASRREEITQRMRELNVEAQGRRFYEEEQHEFDDLDRELNENDEAMVNIRERESRIAAADRSGNTVPGDTHAPVSSSGTVAPTRTRAPGGNSRRLYTNSGVRLPDNIYDLTAYRGFGSSVEEITGLYREAARRVVENIPFESPKAEKQALQLLKGKDATFATRVLTTGSDMYDRAFGKMVMGKPLTTQEDSVLKAAITNTGLGSETPVPVTIDPTVMMTSDGAVNPLRELARVVQITGTKWQGISTDGVDVAYEAELTQVGAQTPDFLAPTAEVAKAHAYLEFSIEVDQDWGELRNNLGVMFQDAKDMKEANKFLFGSGTNEPEGLLTALVADATSIVYTSTLNTFAVEDLYSLKSSLAPRFRSSAAWLANDDVYSAVRQFDTAGGASLWTQLGSDRPPQLLGRAVYEASEMSGEVTTGDEDIVIYGDFGRGFVIVDRVGMNVELIPHVLGNNHRPIGARALYAYFRNTSALLTPKAFRVLAVKPS